MPFDYRDELVPITEARTRLYELARLSENRDVVLMRHGRRAAVMIGARRYEKLLDRVNDLMDRMSVIEARATPKEMLISLEELESRLDRGKAPRTREARTRSRSIRERPARSLSSPTPRKRASGRASGRSAPNRARRAAGD